MAVEIERKFLVSSNAWRASASEGQRLRQAYLASSDVNAIRIRIVDETRAWLTIKSGNRGLVRDEFEYETPMADAVAMIELRQSSIVDKVRYRVPADDMIWEVDVFAGDNDGLIVAEVELDDEVQEVTLPQWIGREVTGELKYQNSQLAIQPFKSWPSAE